MKERKVIATLRKSEKEKATSTCKLIFIWKHLTIMFRKQSLPLALCSLFPRVASVRVLYSCKIKLVGVCANTMRPTHDKIHAYIEKYGERNTYYTYATRLRYAYTRTYREKEKGERTRPSSSRGTFVARFVALFNARRPGCPFSRRKSATNDAATASATEEEKNTCIT